MEVASGMVGQELARASPMIMKVNKGLEKLEKWDPTITKS